MSGRAYWWRFTHLLRDYRRGVIGGLGALTATGTALYLGRGYLRRSTTKSSSVILSDTLQSPTVQDKASDLSKLIVHDILNDPKAIQQATEFVRRVLLPLLEDPQTAQHVVNLLQIVAAKPETQELLSELFLRILRQQNIQDQVNLIANRAATAVVNDDITRQQVTDMCKDVLADENLQKTAGDTLWRTVAHSITPRFMQGKEHPAHSHTDQSVPVK